jgi:hypothetical protein
MSVVLFSFDIEEFDMPLEYKKNISMDEQIRISVEGTNTILNILKKHNIKSTFFSTANFGDRARDTISKLCSDGHELASHGYFHSRFEESHLLSSKKKLEELSGMPITGFRMARMMPVNEIEIAKAGYIYNSSLNPTFIPGRYNNFLKPRTIFKKDTLVQLPASVTPLFRLPLFWISFHNFPLWFYQSACLRTMKKDGYLNLYFHPWEFTNLSHSRFGLPSFLSKNSGQLMVDRFEKLILWMRTQNFSFDTIQNFLEKNK